MPTHLKSSRDATVYYLPGTLGDNAVELMLAPSQLARRPADRDLSANHPFALVDQGLQKLHRLEASEIVRAVESGHCLK